MCIMIKKQAKCILVIILTGVFFMGSCSPIKDKFSKFLMTSDDRIQINLLEQVLEAIENKDNDALKSLFSLEVLNKMENFQENANALFEFFEGEIISKKMSEGPTVFDNMESNNHRKKISSYFFVQTDKQRYFILMDDVPTDTSSPNNVGLYLLLVVKAEYEEKIWDEKEKILYTIVNGEIEEIPHFGIYLPFK